MASISSELTLFTDEDRLAALQVIDQLTRGGSDPETLGKILSKYQEQSTLLDPHLASLVDPLANQLVAELRRCPELQAIIKGGSMLPFQRIRIPILQPLCGGIRQLCRVRGYKSVVKCLPHDVQDLEPCLRLLQAQVSS